MIFLGKTDLFRKSGLFFKKVIFLWKVDFVLEKWTFLGEKARSAEIREARSAEPITKKRQPFTL